MDSDSLNQDMVLMIKNRRRKNTNPDPQHWTTIFFWSTSLLDPLPMPDKVLLVRNVPVVVFIALFPAEEGVGSVRLVHRITVPPGFQHLTNLHARGPEKHGRLFMPRGSE